MEAAARAGEPFALVLMNMQMPVLNRLEATRRLRTSGFSAEALPVIALTANAFGDHIEACLAADMQAHLIKSVHVRNLTNIMARFLGAEMRFPRPLKRSAASSSIGYRARKDYTLRMLQRIADVNTSDDAAVAKAADLLHKLAGTAAMFGEAKLGELAKRLEDDLMTWSVGERITLAGEAMTAFKRAA